MLSLFTITMGYLGNTMKQSFEWLPLLRFSSTGFLLLCSSYSFLQSARYAGGQRRVRVCAVRTR